MTGIEWVIGSGIFIGLGLIITMIVGTYDLIKGKDTFFAFMTMPCILLTIMIICVVFLGKVGYWLVTELGLIHIPN